MMHFKREIGYEVKMLKHSPDEFQISCTHRDFCIRLMRMDRLTAPLLRELIDHIDVFETEGKGKSRTQRIVIYYRFVGYVEIPEVSRRPNIVADTRKGVAVEYLTEPKTA